MATDRAIKARAFARRMMSTSKFGLGLKTFTRENLSTFNPATQEYNTTGTPITYQAYCAPVNWTKNQKTGEVIFTEMRQLYIALNEAGDIPEINDKVTIKGKTYRLGKQLAGFDINEFDTAFLFEIGV